MKKLVFIMQLMAISLLASCGGGNNPQPSDTYTITFKNEGTEYMKIVNAKYGDEIVAPEIDPKKPDDKKYYYIFNTWYYEGTETELEVGDTVKGNTVLVADYTKDPIEYDVTFKKDGQTDITKQFSIENLSITAPEFTPTTHYTGVWNASGDHAGEITADGGATITFTESDLSAWEFTYQETAIIYDLKFYEKDGTTLIDTLNVSLDEPEITLPYHTVTEHYENGKWYCEGKEFPDEPGEKITFNQDTIGNYDFVWQETPIEYEVKFYNNDIELVNKQTISAASKTILAPTIEDEPEPGYRYAWVCESPATIIESGACKELTDSQLGDYIFLETGGLINEYAITYELYGGQASGNPTTYTIQDDVELKDPTKNGFIFKGWCLGPNETSPLDDNGWSAGDRTGDITLYANWHINDATLESTEWSNIASISNRNEAYNYFDIGEEKTVKINTKNHKVRIIGFNHDDLSDGSGKAGITFEFVNLITNKKGFAVNAYWNYEQEDESNNYDYRESTLNDFLNDENDDSSVINMLPSSGDPTNPDLRDVIKPVDKKVGVYNGTSYVATSFDGEDHPYPYLFPLAYDEISKIRYDEGVTNEEGKTYEYYKLHDGFFDMIKQRVDSEGYETYWLRSPYANSNRDSRAWAALNMGGISEECIYDITFAIAPAFCI